MHTPSNTYLSDNHHSFLQSIELSRSLCASMEGISSGACYISYDW